MKKALLPLLSIVVLVSCYAPASSPVTNLKAEAQGHFTEAQLNYLTNNDPSNTSPYNGNMSVSKPLPITISWEDNDQRSATYAVRICEGDDSSSRKTILYYINIHGNSFDFYNPIFDKDYYINIEKQYSNGGVIACEDIHVKESPTVKGPRNLYVDGVENFRDIGGWGYIKQGMIYRSGRFNEDKEETIKASITEDGLFEVNAHLKIKTEIDLRRTSNNEVGGLTDKSVLSNNVNYYQLPMAYGGNNILTFTGKLSGDDWEYNNPGEIKEFFKILADEKNYPINFHCSIGKDRTLHTWSLCH